MAEREHPISIRGAGVERSTEDIRQDIAKEKESISQAIEQIGERVKKKMDWRGYVRDSPYWALGAAAGLGYLASRGLTKRPTPVEQIMRPIAEELRRSLGGLLAGAAGSGLIKVTLISIATKAAANWIENASSTNVARGGSLAQPQTRGGSTVRQEVDAQNSIKTNN
jgi:hypothetical protein